MDPQPIPPFPQQRSAPAAEQRAETPEERHEREVREARREEWRLFVWEVIAILVVIAVVLIRQQWLV